MTINVFYLTVSICSLCAIWLVWEFGFKTLFLDAFRQRLFELRISLFNMGETGLVSFDDEAYRAVETILNGFIRYAHRMTFFGYICSIIANARAKRDDKDYVDFGLQLALKISRLSPQAQTEITAILGKVRSAVALYLAATSLIFKIIFVVYAIAKLFNPERAEEKVTQQVIVIEREVYISARSRAAYMATPLTTAHV